MLNKSKKIINKFEYINEIKNSHLIIEKSSKIQKLDKKNQKLTTKKIKIKEELKRDKKPRTLWVRKKKS